MNWHFPTCFSKSIIVFFSLILCGCQTFSKIPVYNSEKDESVVPPTEPLDTSEYKFSEIPIDKPGVGGALRFRMQDRIKLSVWGYPELDHVAEVQANGKATFPLVGEVNVAGQTAGVVRGEVRKKLQELSQPESPELRFGDIVNLFVWQHEELAYSAAVQPDGSITLPLVGPLKVTGKPLSELNTELNKRLAEHITNPRGWLIPEVQARKVVQDPVVSILPVKLTERQATVIGEVFVQGQQSLKPDMRVLDLLANARMKNDASLDNVIVIRNYNSAEPQYRKCELGKYLKGQAPMQNIYIREGDLVLVPKTTIAQVGYFIEVFFTRTKPVFDWYLAGQQAANYNSIRQLTNSVNRAAKEAFELNTANPTIP
ncbi:polysaccharide biosynthesis/export family protein [Endozoicomonas arenosclerae]|uniref:polysaccharide biosynthesis/export family protein n=1 Tax=Endozoicomonas arenosclerae TaxID=1633495 RepID=UPI000782C06F|nr:polysaccharide biosynthesis/export family protein [Endozoicomonas arenosclerae]